MKAYQKFLKGKGIESHDAGLKTVPELSPMLYDFQRDIVSWALRRGRASIFADCGLGKTPMQLEWARHVPGRVLILAPLAVSQQTIKEGQKFGITDIVYASNQDDIGDEKIAITNYERLEKFNPSFFNGIVLDESSIIKNYTGKYRNIIIESFAQTPYKLACTATPAPNDYMELGNHAEFMGAMTRVEMLSMFFVHDGGETQKWRLKGHANVDFWEWICSWAVMMRKPSDLGYDDGKFILPGLNLSHHTVEADNNSSEYLFAMEAHTLQERLTARRDTIQKRSERVAGLVNGDRWIIWCNLNTEAETVTKMIPGAVNVTGSMSLEAKESAMADFSAGNINVLVTKPKIAGFGMNWQHCHNVAFLGLNDSWESYYQAVRRCWRFGQESEVMVNIVTADIEGAVVENIKRKEAEADAMAGEMLEHMKDINAKNIKGLKKSKAEYVQEVSSMDRWTAVLGDCIEHAASLDSGSIDYTIFSPPFASLYTYSNSDRDMGNCKDHGEFFEHFNFLVGDLLRVTAPGRLLSFHCMNLPTSKTRNGFIGITDFRGDLIRMFVEAGWIFHSEVVIWKNPVTAMQRTKALGLLHKQIVKDSTMSRQGIPDYLVTMRKPGENEGRVSGELTEFVGDPDTFEVTGRMSIDIWQRYASPVWMDIRAGRTLQKTSARDEKDERHICPLQLDVIERCLQLWTNPDDLVYSPFMGIASEGHCALKMGRRFCGVELKESYYRQAIKNLKIVEDESMQGDLFDNADEETVSV